MTACPFADLFVANFHIFARDPARVLTRAFVSQQLLHGGGNKIRVVAQLGELFGITHQSEQSVADQIRGRLLPADHGHDTVGDDLFFGQPIAIDLRRHEGVNQSFARMFARFADRVLKIGGQVVGALEHARNSVGIMLKVSEHLREIRRPFFRSA